MVKKGKFITKLGVNDHKNMLCKIFVTPKVAIYNNGSYFGYYAWYKVTVYMYLKTLF